MRILTLILLFSMLFSMALFAQSDRGTITGTITDAAGGVVANASVEARQVGTGAVYQAGTSATGNYTISQLPAGNYEMTVTLAGFKKFVRQGLAVEVAQTLRIDAQLEVGNTTESITVTEAVPLLKTESAEQSTTVSGDTINDLPINFAIGGAGI